MTLASDVLAALDIPRTVADIRERVVPTIGDLDSAIESLVTGCYIVREGALYRRSTADERAKWMAAPDAERAGR